MISSRSQYIQYVSKLAVMRKLVSDVGRERFGEIVSKFTSENSNPNAKVILTDEFRPQFSGAIRIVKVKSGADDAIGGALGTVWAVQVDCRTSQSQIVSGSGVIVAFEEDCTPRDIRKFGEPICYHEQDRSRDFHAVPSMFGSFCDPMWESCLRYSDEYNRDGVIGDFIKKYGDGLQKPSGGCLTDYRRAEVREAAFRRAEKRAKRNDKGFAYVVSGSTENRIFRVVTGDIDGDPWGKHAGPAWVIPISTVEVGDTVVRGIGYVVDGKSASVEFRCGVPAISESVLEGGKRDVSGSVEYAKVHFVLSHRGGFKRYVDAFDLYEKEKSPLKPKGYPDTKWLWEEELKKSQPGKLASAPVPQWLSALHEPVEPLPVIQCAECGSTRVEIQVWQDPNTGETSEWVQPDIDEPDYHWCNDCEKNVFLEFSDGEKLPSVEAIAPRGGFDGNGNFPDEYRRRMEAIAEENKRFLDERGRKGMVSIADEATLADLLCEDMKRENQ